MKFPIIWCFITIEFRTCGQNLPNLPWKQQSLIRHHYSGFFKNMYHWRIDNIE